MKIIEKNIFEKIIVCKVFVIDKHSLRNGLQQ